MKRGGFSEAIAAAEAVAQERKNQVQERRDQVNAAQEALREAERSCAEALDALRAARVVADSELQGCTLVISHFGWKDRKRAVILRKTAGGQLVVRQLGGTLEFKFKMGADGVFVDSKRRGARLSERRMTLDDVPTEFMPSGLKGVV